MIAMMTTALSDTTLADNVAPMAVDMNKVLNLTACDNVLSYADNKLKKYMLVQEAKRRALKINKKIDKRNNKRKKEKGNNAEVKKLLIGTDLAKGEKLIRRYGTALLNACLGGIVGKRGEVYISVAEQLDPSADLSTEKVKSNAWSPKVQSLDKKVDSGRGFLKAILNALPELFPELATMSWQEILDTLPKATAEERDMVMRMITEKELGELEELEEAASTETTETTETAGVVETAEEASNEPVLSRQFAFGDHIDATPNYTVSASAAQQLQSFFDEKKALPPVEAVEAASPVSPGFNPDNLLSLDDFDDILQPVPTEAEAPKDVPVQKKVRFADDVDVHLMQALEVGFQELNGDDADDGDDGDDGDAPVLHSSEDAIAKRLGEAFGIEAETAKWFYSPDWSGKGLTLELEKEVYERAEKAEADRIAKQKANDERERLAAQQPDAWKKKFFNVGPY